MSLKNINKLLLFITLLLLSCKPIEVLKDKKNTYFEYGEVKEFENEEKKEDLIFIDLNRTSSLNLNFIDYYSVSNPLNYLSKTKINKLNTLNFNKNNKLELKSLITIIKNEKIYFLDYKSNFNIYDLENFQSLKSIKIKSELISEYNYPTSLALFNDLFYVAYSDGKIICFNLNGDIIWENQIDDIIKTPIKIHNDNIIVLLSDKIISLNPKSGELNWMHNYYSENILQSTGGDIVNLNHLLFFILPNNRVGEIDTLFGEKNDSIFSNLDLYDSMNNSLDKIHVFKNYISYFDQNEYLTTINFNKNKIILNKNKIENVQSYKFFNNSLITLNDENLLKSFNIFNGNLFWKIDIKSIFQKDNTIINIASSPISFFIFFKDGNILELDHKTGKILSTQKLKLKNINSVYFINKYILLNQQNGKVSLFIQ